MAFPFGTVSSAQLLSKNHRRNRTTTLRHRESQARKARLLFDPLEPRLLLSADVLTVDLGQLPSAHQDHNLVVEMVTQTQQVGDVTEDVQRVQIIDQAQNNAVLAFGDLSLIKQINIIGDTQGTTANSVHIDVDSFGGLALPTISFAGGGGANSLKIDHDGGTETWQIDAPGSGQASGLADVTFTNVQQLIGGGGGDVLAGSAADTTFTVTGAGEGNLINPGSGSPVTMGFAGFEYLQGAANNNDSFVITQTGMIAAVDGGDGGFDTLVLDGSYGTLLSSPVDAHSGAITLDGDTIQYAGLEPITASGTVADVVYNLPTGADATLSAIAGQPGWMRLAGSTFETTNFMDPTSSLTINLSGYNGQTYLSSTLTIASFDNLFGTTSSSGTSFIVNTPGNNNPLFGIVETTTLNVNSGVTIATHGGAVSLNTLNVNLKSGATIDTTSATAASGAITIAGASGSTQGPHNITVESGVTLNAGAVGGAAGDITIATIDSSWRPVELPFAFASKSVGIAFSGSSTAPVTITGGNVTITATATDTTLPTDAPAWAAGFTSNLQGWFQQVPGNILSAKTGLDASVMYRGANAEITVDNTNITSAKSVKIASSTEVSAVVNAIATSNGTTVIPNFQAAVGVAVTTSTVKTIVSGATTIAAAKDVTISANGSTTAKATARTSNLLTQNPDPNASSVAIALSLDSLTDYAEVQNGVAITATTGNVSVTATGKTSNKSSASAGFVDALTGISAAIPIDLADVHAYLNGTVTAGGTVTGQSGPTFNPQTDVNLVTSQITLPTIDGLPGGLSNGQQIVYTANGAPIGGLVDGGTYTVVVIDSTHIQLANGPTLALDPTGLNPASTQTLTGVTAIAFNLDSIDSSQNTIRIAQNGFAEGDIVTYDANSVANTITGLTSGTNYKIHVIDSDNFQLIDIPTGNVVPISQGQALGEQTFTRNKGAVDEFSQSLNLARIENNAIIAQPGTLTNGQTVIYQSLEADGADPIGGLVNVNQYTAQVSGNTIQLVNPSTGQVVAITDPGAASAQSLGWGTSYGFNPATAVDGTTGTIYLPGNNLKDGDVVSYQVDPNLTTTVTVPTQIPNPNYDPDQPIGPNNPQYITGTMTVTAADQEIGGLVQGGTYYVVKIDQDHIRLTEDDTTAALAKPITLTSKGNATSSQLVTSTSADSKSGITVSSSLTASDAASAKPETGGKFNWSKYSNFLTQSDVTLFALFTDKTTASVVTGKTAADPANNKPSQSIQNNSFSSAGAVDFIYAQHTSVAAVGNKDNQGTTALVSGSNVNVSSTLKQTYQEIAQASVSKPGGSQGVGLALAIAIGTYNNDNEAIIYGNASVDARNSVSVSAALSYPPLNDTVPFSAAFWQNWLEQLQKSGISAVTNMLDGTLGLATNYLNTWAIAGVKALDPSKPAPSTAITGSIVVNVFDNTSNALIKSGAKINQLGTPGQPPAPSGWLKDQQSVSLSATATIQMLDVAGNGKWSLNPFGILGKLTPTGGKYFPGESKSLSDQWNAGDIVALGGSAGATAVGGSIMVPVMTNTTKALIEGGAKVFAGQNGTLSINANESIFRVRLRRPAAPQRGRMPPNGPVARSPTSRPARRLPASSRRMRTPRTLPAAPRPRSARRRAARRWRWPARSSIAPAARPGSACRPTSTTSSGIRTPSSAPIRPSTRRQRPHRPPPWHWATRPSRRRSAGPLSGFRSPAPSAAPSRRPRKTSSTRWTG